MLEKGSRGIISTKDIKKGDVIMRIPNKYIIDLTICRKLVPYNFDNSNSNIATYILSESLNKRNKLTPYLDTLPKDVSEYVHYYDKKKLALLKGTSMMCNNFYNNIINNIKNDAHIAYLLLEIDDDQISLKDFIKLFIKFRIYADSRIFSYTKNNDQEEGLVPYADLLNHSNNPNTTWYFNDSTNEFIVEATKNIKKNHEIYDSYGDKSNTRLVIYYGFSIPNNPHSELSFSYKNKPITLTRYSNLDQELENNKLTKYKEDIIKHLKDKLSSHYDKERMTDDANIKNILNDEIIIIKKILQ